MGDHDSDPPDMFLAKLSEQAERFDDMVMYMKKICADKGGALEMEERNILSVAFKNVISAHRSSVRIMRAAEKKEIDKDSDKAVFASQYRAKVEEELQKACDDILGLLEGSLIAKAKEPDGLVFYMKMQVGEHVRCGALLGPPLRPFRPTRLSRPFRASHCLPRRPTTIGTRPSLPRGTSRTNTRCQRPLRTRRRR